MRLHLYAHPAHDVTVTRDADKTELIWWDRIAWKLQHVATWQKENPKQCRRWRKGKHPGPPETEYPGD